jgi:hypothetical protein
MECEFCEHGHGCPYLKREDMLHVLMDIADNDAEGRVIYGEVQAALAKLDKIIREKYVKDDEFLFNLDVACDCGGYVGA